DRRGRVAADLHDVVEVVAVVVAIAEVRVAVAVAILLRLVAIEDAVVVRVLVAEVVDSVAVAVGRLAGHGGREAFDAVRDAVAVARRAQGVRRAVAVGLALVARALPALPAAVAVRLELLARAPVLVGPRPCRAPRVTARPNHG